MAVALQPDGKIIAGGAANANSTLNTSQFGLARLNKDGLYLVRNTFRYDPNGQFNVLALGKKAYDTFTYAASNGILTDTATVSITVIGGIEMYLPVMKK